MAQEEGTVVAESDADSRTTDIDRQIGARIRERRVALGLSQAALGRAIECTYQQVHKYESGLNRISASRLRQVCAVLRISADELLAIDDGVTGERANRGFMVIVQKLRGLDAGKQAAVGRMIRELSVVRSPEPA